MNVFEYDAMENPEMTEFEAKRQKRYDLAAQIMLEREHQKFLAKFARGEFNGNENRLRRRISRFRKNHD